MTDEEKIAAAQDLATEIVKVVPGDTAADIGQTALMIALTSTCVAAMVQSKFTGDQAQDRIRRIATMISIDMMARFHALSVEGMKPQ